MVYRLKKDELAYRKIGDEFFILTTADSMLHNIKGVGVRILELLEEDRTEEEIRAALSAEYDAPAAHIEADLASFLAELEAKGIVTSNES